MTTQDFVNEKCKYCTNLNLTIVEPSDKQYCTLQQVYVDKTDICEQFKFDEELAEIWEKSELGLFDEDYDESKDLTKHYAYELEADGDVRNTYDENSET